MSIENVAYLLASILILWELITRSLCVIPSKRNLRQEKQNRSITQDHFHDYEESDTTQNCTYVRSEFVQLDIEITWAILEEVEARTDLQAFPVHLEDYEGLKVDRHVAILFDEETKKCH